MVAQITAQGGQIHQIVMTDHGMGYQFADDSEESLNSLLLIEGDGVDTDQTETQMPKLIPIKYMWIHILEQFS